MTQIGYTPKGADTGRPEKFVFEWLRYWSTNGAELWGLDQYAQAAIMHLATAANPDGTSVALSRGELARRLGLSKPDKVSQITKRLREVGAIVRVFEPKGGRGNKLSPVHWLTLPWEPHRKIAFEASKLLGVPYVEPPALLTQEEAQGAKESRKRVVGKKSKPTPSDGGSSSRTLRLVELRPSSETHPVGRATTSPIPRDVVVIDGKRVTREEFEKWKAKAEDGMTLARRKVEELSPYFEAA
ncbi:MarR family transcriptional regulator [Streptomyces fungicidicus]|uniref:MarR family transcriptional regulator n=1 Tax=Streptomyces fungicidicus TaxID=68203 RepID=UPI0038015400